MRAAPASGCSTGPRTRPTRWRWPDHALLLLAALYIDDGRHAPSLVERTLRNILDVKPTLYFNVPRGFDMLLTLEKALSGALKKAKPGTKEFRLALKEGMETMGRTVFSRGVMNWTAADHWGFTNETGVMLKVVNGHWKVE